MRITTKQSTTKIALQKLEAIKLIETQVSTPLSQK